MQRSFLNTWKNNGPKMKPAVWWHEGNPWGNSTEFWETYAVHCKTKSKGADTDTVVATVDTGVLQGRNLVSEVPKDGGRSA